MLLFNKIIVVPINSNSGVDLPRVTYMDSQKFRFFVRKGNNRMISCQIRERSVKMSYGGGRGNLRNPCLTMHQPWASLLIYGIKRIEGRSWPAPLTGTITIQKPYPSLLLQLIIRFPPLQQQNPNNCGASYLFFFC